MKNKNKLKLRISNIAQIILDLAQIGILVYMIKNSPQQELIKGIALILMLQIGRGIGKDQGTISIKSVPEKEESV